MCDDEPSDLDRQVLRERISAIRNANRNRTLTAQFLADEIGLSYSTRDFHYLTDEIEEAGGKLEIRIAHLPLNWHYRRWRWNPVHTRESAIILPQPF
jgi:hypothetical protein